MGPAESQQAPGVGVGRPLPTGGGGDSSTEEKPRGRGCGIPLPQGCPTHPQPNPEDSRPRGQHPPVRSRPPERLGVPSTLQFSPSREEGPPRTRSCTALWLAGTGPPSGQGTHAGSCLTSAALKLGIPIPQLSLFQQHQEQPADITVVFGVPQSSEQSGSRLPVGGWLGGCGLLCVSTAQARLGSPHGLCS